MEGSGDKRIALITGATSGIGREIAFQLAAKGWGVLITGRDAAKGHTTLQGLQHLFPDPSHGLWLGDLSDLKQVEALAKWAQSRSVQVLVNNAGGAFSGDTPLQNGLSQTYLLNLLAPWLLTKLMLPGLLQTQHARVIFTSSSLHYYSSSSEESLIRAKREDSPINYGIIKLAQIAWMQHIVNELRGQPVSVLAADPGIAQTDNFAKNYKGITGGLLRAFWLTYPDFQTKRNAARPAVLAASEPKYAWMSGKYIGPDGSRQAVARSARDLSFGRWVDRICEADCGVQLGSGTIPPIENGQGHE